jgi:hypothetical protein
MHLNLMELLQQLADSVLTWIVSLGSPLKTVSETLLKFEIDRSLVHVTKLWLPPLLISVVFNYPLLALFGIH